MKLLRLLFGIIGAISFLAVIFGYTQSWWVILVGALGCSFLCVPDKDFKVPPVPMVGPRTHDVDEEGGV